MSRLIKLFSHLFLTKKDSLYYQIKSITGFYPDNLKLYKQALTHKSVAEYNAKGQCLDNERLEFLGDAILDSVLADYLFKKYPYQNEGFLTQMRSKVVNRKQLGLISKEIGLHDLLEINTTRKFSHTHIYGNAFEAFIGAIYLDKGFYRSQKFIVNQIIKNHVDIKELSTHNTNYKSQIIEWSQKKDIVIQFNTYENPQKENAFISFITIKDEAMKKAMGYSKKEAEQNAAFIALKQLKIINE